MNLAKFFSDALKSHEYRLDTLHERFKRGLITEDQLKTGFFVEQMAWRDLKDQLSFDYQDFYKATDVRYLDEEQKRKYDIRPDEPLCGLLEYRDHIIPMYNDDPGQQIFAIFEGRILSGGPFNMHYCEAFIAEIDYTLDHKIAFGE